MPITRPLACLHHSLPLPPFTPLQGSFLPGFKPTPDAPRICYGLRRLDHAVGNTHDLLETVNYIINMTGGRGGPARYACGLACCAPPGVEGWQSVGNTHATCWQIVPLPLRAIAG